MQILPLFLTLTTCSLDMLLSERNMTANLTNSLFKHRKQRHCGRNINIGSDFCMSDPDLTRSYFKDNIDNYDMQHIIKNRTDNSSSFKTNKTGEHNFFNIGPDCELDNKKYEEKLTDIRENLRSDTFKITSKEYKKVENEEVKQKIEENLKRKIKEIPENENYKITRKSNSFNKNTINEHKINKQEDKLYENKTETCLDEVSKILTEDKEKVKVKDSTKRISREPSLEKIQEEIKNKTKSETESNIKHLNQTYFNESQTHLSENKTLNMENKTTEHSKIESKMFENKTTSTISENLKSNFKDNIDVKIKSEQNKNTKINTNNEKELKTLKIDETNENSNKKEENNKKPEALKVKFEEIKKYNIKTFKEEQKTNKEENKTVKTEETDSLKEFIKEELKIENNKSENIKEELKSENIKEELKSTNVIKSENTKESENVEEIKGILTNRGQSSLTTNYLERINYVPFEENLTGKIENKTIEDCKLEDQIGNSKNTQTEPVKIKEPKKQSVMGKIFNFFKK